MQRVIDQARDLEATDKKSSLPLYQKALAAAREVDQIQLVTKKLRATGQTVDLPRLFGFLLAWKVIGPFDNTATKGFDTAFAPETEIKLDAEYDGKSGKVRRATLPFRLRGYSVKCNANSPSTARRLRP